MQQDATLHSLFYLETALHVSGGTITRHHPIPVCLEDIQGWGGVAALILNPLKPELNPICYLLALLGAHHFLHVSRIRVKLLTLR